MEQSSRSTAAMFECSAQLSPTPVSWGRVLRRSAASAWRRCRSSRSDGWRQRRHPCRRGSTRRTAPGRASAGRSETSPDYRRQGAGRFRLVAQEDAGQAARKFAATSHSVISLSGAGGTLHLEFVAQDSDGTSAATRSADSSRETRSARASWNCRRTARWSTRPAHNRRDAPCPFTLRT